MEHDTIVDRCFGRSCYTTIYQERQSLRTVGVSILEWTGRRMTVLRSRREERISMG